MSGERGDVLKVEGVDQGIDVTVDMSGDGVGDVTAEHYTPPGIDALPLPGDEAVVEEAEGAGEGTVAKYQDLRNKSKAKGGEVRLYARDANGELVAEIWAQGNGDVEIKSIKAGGKIILNGVEIDQDGNISTAGDVKAAVTPAAYVSLAHHMHPTAGTGSPSPPTPTPAP
jgi:hypothetical protein